MILINCPNFDKQNVPITQSTAHTCRASVFLYVSRAKTAPQRTGAMTYFVNALRNVLCAEMLWPTCDGAKSFSGEKHP